MGNAITGKQYQDYKNELFQVMVYSKSDKSKLIHYTYHPKGLIDAYEFAQPFMLEGQYVLIIPHNIYRNCYMLDGTIQTCYDQSRMLAQFMEYRIEKGIQTPVSEREKAEYLINKGYTFINAYTKEIHDINRELLSK